MNQATVFYETRDRDDWHGYTNQSIPQNTPNMDALVLNYYDTYDIPGIPNNQSANFSNKTKGLLTATKVKVLGSSYLWTVNIMMMKEGW